MAATRAEEGMLDHLRLTYLPGCTRAISVFPEPRWPIALRNTRALHGVLTVLSDGGHQRNAPGFTLRPWPHSEGCCGWAAQWMGDASQAFPARHHVSMFNEHRVITLGPVVRFRMPQPRPGAEHILCLDTITPVSIRCHVTSITSDGIRDEGCSVYRTTPTPANIISALRTSRWISTAAGRDLRKGETEPLHLEILGGRTHPEIVQVGQTKPRTWTGGVVQGWAGRLILRCDSRTRWLLEIAELVGLGGRTSLGFGRFRLREVQAP